jgi:hypothetical protein
LERGARGGAHRGWGERWGFNSGEKRRAPAARGGQAVTRGREGGHGVLARLAFTQRRVAECGARVARCRSKEEKGGGGGPAQWTSKWSRKGGGLVWQVARWRQGPGVDSCAPPMEAGSS